MNTIIDPVLLEMLACPDCGGELTLKQNKLVCKLCNHAFDVKHKIPLLYTADVDMVHFNEEINLAEMMQNPSETTKSKVSSEQWRISKAEFWNVIASRIDLHCSILNVGCGFDTHFTEYQDQGVFVNFDIVQSTLQTLSEKYGAKYCVAGDINALPYRNGVFDVVVCIDILHHMENDLRKYISLISRILKPGGFLFVEEPNAWAMFQFPKSIFLPKFIHRKLRSLHHRLLHSDHKPADYEFPISVFKMRRVLSQNGFDDILLYENHSYPNAGKTQLVLFNLLSKYSSWVRKYHNFHFFFSAKKNRGI